jgi:uncharacterized membrane protein
VALLDFIKRKPKEFFSEPERVRIVEAVRQAERRTSGEVRVFVESHCKYMDAIERAAELFFSLKMDKTDLRNGVLVYVALKDRQVAVFGDEGIYKKMSQKFWDAEVKKMLFQFKNDNIPEGIIAVIRDIGEALYQNFPYDSATDKNELPDDIVFGR